MKTIVYFLGAGFSAPAGLPVISNFRFMAQDQYFRESQKYNNFKNVFQYIDSLSKAKNFTNIDLYNIEEIFSIADTHQLLGENHREMLEQFIKDVIQEHTPSIEIEGLRSFEPPFNEIESLFPSGIVGKYVSFCASLLDVVFSGEFYPNISSLVNNEILISSEKGSYDYKVITLNYDRIIEESKEFLDKIFKGSTRDLPLAKLHGSVEEVIVPPTWNKKLNQGIEGEWRDAAKWLSQASEIRIIGYSMPVTDIYIKHLFSTAMIASQNLQRIEVICLDPDGTVYQRYKQMFTFPKFDFYNVNTEAYIGLFTGRKCAKNKKSFRVGKREVESVHNEFRRSLTSDD